MCLHFRARYGAMYVSDRAALLALAQAADEAQQEQLGQKQGSEYCCRIA
jgi:hypothetical protein